MVKSGRASTFVCAIFHRDATGDVVDYVDLTHVCIDPNSNHLPYHSGSISRALLLLYPIEKLIHCCISMQKKLCSSKDTNRIQEKHNNDESNAAV
jgi:hypothetical protein